MFWKKKAKEPDILKTMEIPAKEQEPVAISFHGLDVELKFGNAQHIGKRKGQEDSFGYSQLTDETYLSKHGICAVLSDGMGGLSSGRKVSETVVRKALQFFEKLTYEKPVSVQMEEFVRVLNQEVCNAYHNAQGRPKAGATLIMMVIYGDKLFWCAAGDSRICLVRAGRMYQVNEDHDYKNRLLGDYIHGEGTLNRAFEDRQKDSLSSYIGCPSMKEIDRSIRGYSLQDGDQILLMSDGLYRALSADEIMKRSGSQPQKLCERLVQDALDKKYPGQDNITLLAVEYRWKEKEKEIMCE